MTADPDLIPKLSVATPPTTPNRAAALAGYATMCILVVEPDAGNGGIVATMLERTGITKIKRAFTGAQALQALTQHNGAIDLVVLDMLLPDMDGLQLCGQLGAHTTAPLILMVTPEAAWRNDLGRATGAATAVDLLFRPVHEIELIPRVRRALTLRRQMNHCTELQRRQKQTEQRARELENRVQYLAGHDPLTGLYNRARLEEAIDSALIDARAGHGQSALLYVDVDRFKMIRDYAGHPAGDRLLRNVADALRQVAGEHQIIAHIEADEFAVLLRNRSLDEGETVAEALRQTLAQVSFRTNINIYTVQASIGTAAITTAGVGCEPVIRRARQASYVAKKRGGNLVHRYQRDDAELIDREKVAHWAPLLRRALSDDHFRLVFQPVLNIGDVTIDHYEVLIRMLDDKGSLLPPGTFIPVAEQMGLIHDIDRWVITEAITVLGRQNRALPALSLSINLSGRAFQDDSLVPTIRQQLEKTGIEPSRVTFEITETAAVNNFQRTRAMVTQLHNLGCRFALDDFGAGFASYSYLKEFPFDSLKIDGAFIKNLPHDETDQILVKSMVNIARTLGKKTTAEFVGNSQTLELLRDYGVDRAQGFYIGRPDAAITQVVPGALQDRITVGLK